MLNKVNSLKQKVNIRVHLPELPILCINKIEASTLVTTHAITSALWFLGTFEMKVSQKHWFSCLDQHRSYCLLFWITVTTALNRYLRNGKLQSGWQSQQGEISRHSTELPNGHRAVGIKGTPMLRSCPFPHRQAGFPHGHLTPTNFCSSKK